MDYIQNQLNNPNAHNQQQEFDWLYIEDAFGKTLELRPQTNFMCFNSLPLPYENSDIPCMEFIEDVMGGLNTLDYDVPYFHQDFVVDATQINTFEQNYDITSELSVVSATNRKEYEVKKTSRRKNSAVLYLELEEIQKHFDMPIMRAAKEMKVGLTVLKKRCRELNIMRWPHRKLKSLNSLIKNVKELGLDDEVVMLEEHKRLLEKLPDVELTEKTKKLRQACFKANYKKRRSLATHS